MKTDAWKEDLDGITRVYIIRERGTRRIVLYFSLKCGTLFTTYSLDDAYKKLEDAQKSLTNQLIDLRLNHDDNQYYQMLEQAKMVFNEEQIKTMMIIVEHRVNLIRERTYRRTKVYFG